MKRMVYFEVVTKDGKTLTLSRMLSAEEIGEQVAKLNRSKRFKLVTTIHPDFAPGEEA